MNRDRGIMPKSKKHLSAPNSFTKPNRKTFHGLSRSSSLSSNRTSSEQSNEGKRLSVSQSPKNVSNEDKDSLMRKLQCQVKELRHKLRTLEECIENKEYSLETIAREKDRALGEIRRLERNNKQLRQQLNDERNHYLEEKEKFCEEMTKYKKRLQEMKMGDAGNNKTQSMVPVMAKISAGAWQKGDSAEIQPEAKHLKSATAANVMQFRKSGSLDSVGLYEGQDFSLQMAALRTENAKLRAIINEHEERNYELCLRFLRMKHSKNDLRNRFQDLENEYLQVITNLMEKIDEAREEFNFIIDEKFKKPLHSNNAKYLRIVQRNSKIAFENVTLRMELQNLKKEFNKLNSGQNDNGRKVPDEERNNLAVDEKSRQNARQNRNGTLAPKASDTDSNYMSKTSTTDPSTGSLADAKSNESISGDGLEAKTPFESKTPNSQNLFSEDILHKLFEIIDSHSMLKSHKGSENENCTGEAVCNVDAKNQAKRKSEDQVKSGQNLQSKEIPPLLEAGLGKRFVPCSLNSKKFHEVTTQPATKKIASGKKVKRGIQPIDGVSDKDQLSEISKSRRRIPETGVRPKSRSHYVEVKDRIRSYPDADRTVDSAREGTDAKETFTWNKIKDTKGQDRVERDKVRSSGTPKRYRSRKERRQRVFVRDSCGLEEKLDTDGEISPDYNYQISDRKPRSEKMVDQMTLTKHRTPDEMKVRARERVWREVRAKLDADTYSEDSAIGSNNAKMRNRNSISLHDELMEVTKSQSHKDDPFWRRELNLHSLITEKSASSSKTYRLNGRNSRFLSEGHTTENVEEDDTQERKVLTVETTVLRKNEERERSRSQSPHQSKPGSEQGLLLDTALKSRGSNPTNKNKEVVLRFLMPPATILSTQSFSFGKDDTCKELSMHPAREQESPPHTVQHQLSQLMLPASNMASSCTTMEMGDSSAARENGLASRTLSAPALIESEWLNNFKMWEVKDCSTNTNSNGAESFNKCRLHSHYAADGLQQRLPELLTTEDDALTRVDSVRRNYSLCLRHAENSPRMCSIVSIIPSW